MRDIPAPHVFTDIAYMRHLSYIYKCTENLISCSTNISVEV